ncbi:glycoside hydrolase family 32 protein [Garciella nitratireducens]|uniref:Sucrose-6-phosphate hydrolase n=1 Tax=Garciella nitratireducens DSM 15102 TaxID=1121911 RepID=A0A1T4M520_9FIRM|nr:glycoside hydrolase family 32 protein [Garciella nitratireducens]SJZ61824.1 beta-fructofuranosidase [Garciella nitratireducens DSM 15102]
MNLSVKEDLYDVKYHIRPPHGLLNDPNGLTYFKGVYHVFFQWNQKGTTHHNKSWGHVISKNLIDWVYLDPALEPKDWFDKDGCYSGSAIEYNGKLFLFYTGNVSTKSGERKSYQCLATSRDGMHFEKKGPILEHPKGYTSHVRDPKVWQDTNHIWWMILGAQTQDLKGTCILYRSDNLKNWTFVGPLMQSSPSLGYMWECPDMILLENKDIFIFSPQGLSPKGDFYQNIYQTGYFSGMFKKDGTFIKDKNDFTELDRGFEFYAPQSFVDPKGRRIVFGWMGTMKPELEQAVPTISNGWLHHLSLPRKIEWKNNHLYQHPISELHSLRKEKISIGDTLKRKKNLELSSPQNEILLCWNSNHAENFVFHISKEVAIQYSKDRKRFTVERTNWLTHKKETRNVILKNSLWHLQIFMESSSLEIFINKGEEVFSLRYFPQNFPLSIGFETNWNRQNSLDTIIYPLKSNSIDKCILQKR